MMIQLLGRYAWVVNDGKDRLLNVERDEPGDISTFPSGGWIAFAQASRSEAQMAYDGIKYGPDGIVDKLESRGVPYRCDEELAIVLVSVSHFHKFMQPLVLDRGSISEEVRLRLLLERENRLRPLASEPKKTKVKKHPDRVEKLAPTLDEKPLANPLFSVHPGASIDQWGPVMQTGMLNEAFRALTFFAHDCNMDDSFHAMYQVLSVLRQNKPFWVTNAIRWPATNCRILVASKPLQNRLGTATARWELPAKSGFLIVDNYQYRGVRQITLLALTPTQVPFFLNGMAPQTIKLSKRARSDLHQKSLKVVPNASVAPGSTSDAFLSKPHIMSPYGDWQNNPSMIAWLAEQS